MDLLYRHFGRTLRARRKSAGLTQAEVAERTGLSRTSITNIEVGRQHVSLHVLYELADAVGAKPTELLPDSAALVAHNAELDRALAKLPIALDDDERAWIQRLVTKSEPEEMIDDTASRRDQGGKKTA